MKSRAKSRAKYEAQSEVQREVQREVDEVQLVDVVGRVGVQKVQLTWKYDDPPRRCYVEISAYEKELRMNDGADRRVWRRTREAADERERSDVDGRAVCSRRSASGSVQVYWCVIPACVMRRFTHLSCRV